MTAGVLSIFIVILAVGGLATAAKAPADITVNQFTTSVEQASPAVRLAQSTTSPGTMLGGAGLFGPGVGAIRGGTGGFPFMFQDELGLQNAPPVKSSTYRRCPWGGFDCDR